jgi:hypothetical protein
MTSSPDSREWGEDILGARALAVELVPLWIKLAYTLFLCVLVPVYWIH